MRMRTEYAASLHQSSLVPNVLVELERVNHTMYNSPWTAIDVFRSRKELSMVARARIRGGENEKAIGNGFVCQLF